MNKRRTLKRWLVTLVTGVLTGLTAILVTTGTGALTDWKFRVVSVLQYPTHQWIASVACMHQLCTLQCQCL